MIHAKAAQVSGVASNPSPRVTHKKTHHLSVVGFPSAGEVSSSRP